MRFAKVILDQNEKKFEQKVSDEIKVMQEVGLMLSDFKYTTYFCEDNQGEMICGILLFVQRH